MAAMATVNVAGQFRSPNVRIGVLLDALTWGIIPGLGYVAKHPKWGCGNPFQNDKWGCFGP